MTEDGPNPLAFGTFGTLVAEQALVPKASGSRSSETLGKNMKILFLVTLLITDVALGNSYSIELIALPQPDSVVAFTNGFPVSTGERQMKKKEDIVKFLKDGVYLRKVPSAEDQMLLIQNPGKTTDGYFTDKNGRFYSWTLLSPTLLWLKTPEGGGAILEIKNK